MKVEGISIIAWLLMQRQPCEAFQGIESLRLPPQQVEGFHG